MNCQLIVKCLGASALAMATLQSQAAQAPDTISLSGDPTRGRSCIKPARLATRLRRTTWALDTAVSSGAAREVSPITTIP